MKMTQFLLISILSVFSLSGCTPFFCPKPKIVKKIVYLKPIIPDLPKKPIRIKYKFKAVNFNGFDYYVLTPNDAAIMSVNWNEYKNWAELNRTILERLKDSNNTGE